MKKKNIYLIVLGALVLLLVILAFLLIKKPNQVMIEEPKFYEPSFLSAEQKASFGLAAETKAQVFYDESGQLVYKIIKDESDIVTNPANFGLKK